LGFSLDVFQFEVALLNLFGRGAGIREVVRKGAGRHKYLSLWVILGSLSFKRAISVCMNLLYALSFFFAPPTGVDLAVSRQVVSITN
jgi:hypothetical protein